MVVLLSATACGGDSRGSPTTLRYGGLYQGLCESRAEATDPDAARRTFFDHVHRPLHELASEAAAADRGAASRLLEAKEAVERGLAGEPATLAADLDRLLDATGGAIRATGGPTPKPCKERL
ncbi:MAG: hypothetical protein ACRD03_08660 [Acidimicrobiales bacterium]